MTRTLRIEVRFHDGRYHGAGDWPPSPARLFQALVAAAANPNLDDASRRALAWLEQQTAPTIAAPAAHSGQPNFKLFVPNNDLDAKGGDIRRVAEVRSATKHIRPRLFDASVPLLYAWRFDDVGDAEPHAKYICKIAERLYQLGRGVDMAWAVGEVLDEAAAETRLAEYPGAMYRPAAGGQGMVLDCPDQGSLGSLEARHAAGATRFRRNGSRTEFANAPKPRFRSVAYNSPTVRFLFELRRTTESGSPFAPWPMEKAAALVQKLRGNDGSDGQPESGAFAPLAKHCNRGVVSRILIGRSATAVSKTQRIRIVPLPSIGHVHADHGIRRVLVEVPPDCPIRSDDIAWAFSGLEVEPPEVDADGVIVSAPVELVRAGDDSMLEHYGIGSDKTSRLWRSVTPLALPPSAARRRIEPARMREEAEDGAKCGAERQVENQHATHAVAQALRHAGIRESVVSVRVQREPFEARGTRADAFAAGTRFSKHQLWHVETTFATPVNGPLILGDGRYTGLGVMASVQESRGIHAFRIESGLSPSPDPHGIARALRRAVISRVQAVRQGERLRPYFTGHELDGSPAQTADHLAFAFDPLQRRLLVLAPHVIGGRPALNGELAYLDTLDEALANFDELRAGASGLLRIRSESLAPEEDPLLAPSCRWESLTPYQVTRHAKKVGAAEALSADVQTECRRRGLPHVRVTCASLRGVPGQGLFGMVRLEFKVAVAGPILLGRSRYLGGGLFAQVRSATSM